MSVRYIDDLVDAAGAARHLDDLVDMAGTSRYVDEALDGATVRRLNSLDEFTGGNRALKQGDELRQALTNRYGGATLKERRLATKVWKRFQVSE